MVTLLWLLQAISGNAVEVQALVFEVTMPLQGTMTLTRVAGYDKALACPESKVDAASIQLVAYQDVYNDGIADVLAICTMPTGGATPGWEWFLLNVSPSGLTALPFGVSPFDRGSRNAVAPSSVAVVGDLNDDTLLDLLLVVSPTNMAIVMMEYNTHPAMSFSVVNVSEVFPIGPGPHFTDSPERPLAEAPVTYPAAFTSVVGCGDTNGDGFPEVLLGIASSLYLLQLAPYAVGSPQPPAKPFHPSDIDDFTVEVVFQDDILPADANNVHHLRWVRYLGGTLAHRSPGRMGALLQVQSVGNDSCGALFAYQVTVVPPDLTVPVILPSNCIQAEASSYDCCRGTLTPLYAQRHVYVPAWYGGMPCGAAVVEYECDQPCERKLQYFHGFHIVHDISRHCPLLRTFARHHASLTK